MTKINKQKLTMKCKKLARHAMIKNKLSVKRMKLAICDETHASSSDDDHFPMLPPTSSSSSCSSLSPIEEEEHNSTSISTVSSTSNSRYLSSFYPSSASSLSSSDDDFNRYEELNNKSVDVSTKELAHCSKKDENVTINIASVSQTHESTQCDVGNHQRHSIVEDIEHLGLELIQHSMHHSMPDIESYHQTKNFAFLLLNLALLSANGNQIKFLLESPEQRPFLYYSLTFIGLSLFFQFIAKAFSLSSFRYKLNNQEGASKLKLINGFILIFTLIITILNIGISLMILFEIYEILPW